MQTNVTRIVRNRRKVILLGIAQKMEDYTGVASGEYIGYLVLNGILMLFVVKPFFIQKRQSILPRVQILLYSICLY